MSKLVVAGLAALCLAPVVLPAVLATTDEFPAWAFPVDPPAAPGARMPKDDGTPLPAPDSDVTRTRSPPERRHAPPHWHPDDRPDAHLEQPRRPRSGRGPGRRRRPDAGAEGRQPDGDA